MQVEGVVMAVEVEVGVDVVVEKWRPRRAVFAGEGRLGKVGKEVAWIEETVEGEERESERGVEEGKNEEVVKKGMEKQLVTTWEGTVQVVELQMKEEMQEGKRRHGLE